MREERRLRVFQKRVFRNFGPKRDGATGEGRKLHNEELNDLYSRTTVWVTNSRRMNWVRHVALMGESRGVYVAL